MNLNEPANSTCVTNSAKTPQSSPQNNNGWYFFSIL